MEIKKSPKANLEDKRMTGLLLGFVVVLAVLFVAFEWSQRDVQIDLSNVTRDVITEEEMEITIQEEKPAPPPPPAPSMSEELQIIEDDSDVEETVIETTEDTGEAVEIKEVEVIEEEEPEEQTVFVVVEDMPKFPGGMGACLKYLGKNIKYPTIAQENGIQGRVVVQFIVNKDGSIVNPVVVRSVDPYLDKEALRVIKSMPKWTPGKQRGKAVRVKYTVPVTFRLQ